MYNVERSYLLSESEINDLKKERELFFMVDDQVALCVDLSIDTEDNPDFQLVLSDFMLNLGGFKSNVDPELILKYDEEKYRIGFTVSKELLKKQPVLLALPYTTWKNGKRDIVELSIDNL